jgi:hypothetical protein
VAVSVVGVAVAATGGVVVDELPAVVAVPTGAVVDDAGGTSAPAIGAENRPVHATIERSTTLDAARWRSRHFGLAAAVVLMVGIPLSGECVGRR